MPPEAGHASAEAAFHAALWQDAPPEGLTAPAPDEIARRFAVYRNNVQHGLGRALAARFPTVERLVGAAFFAAMGRVFMAASPPTEPVLHRWGGAFPAFLETFAPVAHLAWLADVARIELARGRAYHAADAAAATQGAIAGALASPAPERLRLRLHPSVTLFASRHPAVGIWQANQPGAEPGAALEPGPSRALIGRRPDCAVVVEPVEAGTHAVLAALADGDPLGRAASEADPTAALTLLLRHGLIAAIETGEPT
jgi:hypothetical protein